jgi:hypothetical protein
MLLGVGFDPRQAVFLLPEIQKHFAVSARPSEGFASILITKDRPVCRNSAGNKVEANDQPYDLRTVNYYCTELKQSLWK